MRINIGQMTLSVGAGQELLVGSDRAVVDAALKQDKVGRRELSKHALDDGNHIARSEFSIVGLIQRSELLHSMYAKGAPSDRAIIERVMKMAAALFQVTAKRGAYSAYQAGGTSSAEHASDRAIKVAQSNVP